MNDEINANGQQYRLRRRWYRTVLLFAAAAGLLLLGFMVMTEYKNRLPDELNLLAESEESFDFNLPASAEIVPNVSVVSGQESNVPKDRLHLNFNEPFTIRSGKTGSYTANVKLFGFLTLKKISIGVIDPVSVIPCGNQVGIYLETDGLLVLGTSPVADASGMESEPCLGLLKSGDYILAVDGTAVSRKEALIEEINRWESGELILSVRRGERELSVPVTPVRTADGSVKIGAWIRDDTQGIGTMTYLTQDGSFGALGHGITDVDTGVLMEIGGGKIYQAEIIGIVKGRQGSPGELSGVIHMTDSKRLGDITANTGQCIFGRITAEEALYGEPVEIALKQEVRTGSASILCAAGGSVEEYEIEIEEINLSGKSLSKGLVVHITDEELLELTGGIVQGMSGSPILQDGRLIGAVTHVFIRDSTRGYGIFIENMLDQTAGG